MMRRAKPSAVWLAVGIVALSSVALIHLLIGWNTLRISMQEYTPVMGVGGSPFVGPVHYARLLQQPQFASMLINTVTISLLIMAATALLSAGAVWGLARMPSTVRLFAAIALFAPYAVSQGTMVSAFIALFGSTIFMAPVPSLLFVALYQALLITPYVVLVCMLLLSLVSPVSTPRLMAVCLIGAAAAGWYAGFNGSLMPAMSAAHPLSYAWMDNLKLYAYRVGLLQMQYSMAAAADTLSGVLGKTGLALFGAAGALVAWLPAPAGPARRDDHHPDKLRILAWLPAGLLAFTFAAIGLTGLGAGGQAEARNLAASLVTLISPVIGAALGLAMAAVVIRLPRGGGLLWVGVAVVLATNTSVSVGAYLSARAAGSINTLLPALDSSWTVLLPMLTAAMAWPSMAGEGGARRACQWVLGVALLLWPALLADPIPGLIYAADRSFMPLSTLAYLGTQTGTVTDGGVGFIECLLPLLSLAGGAVLLRAALRVPGTRSGRA